MSKEIQQAVTAEGKDERQRCSGEGGEEYDAYDPFDIVRMKSASVDRLDRLERCTKRGCLGSVRIGLDSVALFTTLCGNDVRNFG
nr:hypothetical protein [Tanacetum cinerariifolium]